jgi:hypothetical protein
MEIEALEDKIYQKTGFLFFKSHKYSIEDLLNSVHHQRINSITSKIGDDIKNWYNSGKLTPDEEEVYFNERDNVDLKLHEINLEIENREPTWWEKVKEPCERFIRIIMSNLPAELRMSLLSFMGSLFKKIPLLIMKK